MNELASDKWIEYAEEDYRAAMKLEPNDTPGPVCNHCQQCIEKYLKAVIVHYGLSAPRHHDLVRLAKPATDHERRVQDLLPDLELLNPHAVDARYPDQGPDPTPGDAEAARLIMETVRSQLRSFLGLDSE